MLKKRTKRIVHLDAEGDVSSVFMNCMGDDSSVLKSAQKNRPLVFFLLFIQI